MKTEFLLTAAASLWLVAACSSTSYYRITDPTTGKTYYTTSYNKSKDGGISFVDTVSGAKVRIRDSELTQIDKDAYRAALGSSDK